ncbi:MAG: chaperone modulator CbpM [Pseudomonadota bacterium]
MNRYTTSMTVEHVVTISRENPLSVDALAHACGADTNWVSQLVACGIVEGPSVAAQPHEWRFDSADLQCALEARRLERDFGVGLEAAALILDLEHEVRRLKAALQVQRR